MPFTLCWRRASQVEGLGDDRSEPGSTGQRLGGGPCGAQAVGDQGAVGESRENGKTLPVFGNLFPRPSADPIVPYVGPCVPPAAGRTTKLNNPCPCMALPTLFGDVLDAP